MTSILDMQVELAHYRAGFAFTPHQVHAIEMIQVQEQEKGVRRRACLYHRTGAGKSITSLAMVKASGDIEEAKLLVKQAMLSESNFPGLPMDAEVKHDYRYTK